MSLLLVSGIMVDLSLSSRLLPSYSNCFVAKQAIAGWSRIRQMRAYRLPRLVDVVLCVSARVRAVCNL